MTVLSDRDIRRRLNYTPRSPGHEGDEAYSIGIEPCDDKRVQPASVDLTLGDEWLVYEQPEQDEWGQVTSVIDIDDAKNVELHGSKANEYWLAPGGLLLCTTAEYVSIPADIQAQVHGKSSLARLGLLVHATAGFIDPGFKGKITLEMYNLNNRSIILRAGKPICQLSMMKLSSTAEFPYGHVSLGSKYQNQTVVTGSRYAG